MAHSFLLYSSSNDVLEKLDIHINKSNSSNALGNVYDIIPFSVASQANFLFSSSKFKDCKDFIKKNKDLTDFKEILYDGNINDLNTIYTSQDESFWVLRIPVNRLLTTYLPSKVKSQTKKDTFLVFVKDGDKQIPIGVADSKIHIFKLIEETCNQSVSRIEITSSEFEIICDGNVFVVKKV